MQTENKEDEHGFWPRVKEVEVLDDYELLITFSSGEQGIFDVKPYLTKGIFTELQNLEYFRQVKAVGNTISWNNRQDFCPDTVYAEAKEI